MNYKTYVQHWSLTIRFAHVNPMFSNLGMPFRVLRETRRKMIDKMFSFFQSRFSREKTKKYRYKIRSS